MGPLVEGFTESYVQCLHAAILPGSSLNAVQNEVNFSSFAEFKKAYFMPFLVTFQKMAVDKGVAKDAADMKEKGKRMAGPLLKWIKAHFDELQFYSLETYMQDASDVNAKYGDAQFAANMAYVRYDNGEPCFYFIRDAFTEVSRSDSVRWQGAAVGTLLVIICGC